MGCRTSRDSAGKVIEPRAGRAGGKPDAPAQAPVLPFVNEEDCDSDRSITGKAATASPRLKVSDSSTQTPHDSSRIAHETQGFDEENCNPLRSAAMACTDDNVDERTNNQRAGLRNMDGTIIKPSPSKASDQRSPREMFATKYRLDLQTLPNSVDEDSTAIDDDRTTVCSSASTEYDEGRGGLLFKPSSVWAALGPGSVEDVDEQTWTWKNSSWDQGQGGHTPPKSIKTMGSGPGLMKLGNRLVWVD